MADIFSFISPEEKAARRKKTLTIVLIVLGAAALIGLIVFLVLNRPRPEPVNPPAIETPAQSIAEIIVDLDANTVRDFSQEEAEELATRIETEWLPRATDAEKGQLLSLEARIYNRANLPGPAATALERTLEFTPEDQRLNLYERLSSAYERLANFPEAKRFAVLVVEHTPDTDSIGRDLWQQKIDAWTAAGY